MWYVIQVKGGGEARARQLIEHIVDSDLYDTCAIPQVRTTHKLHGQWMERDSILFPGYVFLDTRDATRVSVQLHDVPAFTHLLGSDAGFVALSERDVKLISGLVNGEQLMGMSEGFVEGDKIVITDGPLKDYAGSIKRIDRHKKMAYLEFEMFGSTMHVKAGLNIVSRQAQQ